MREKGENKKGPIAVTRSSLPPLEEYVEMLKPLWESAWLTNMGDYHEEFKRQLKVYLKAQNLELFVNGHMALELALQALGLKGEVITTPFSFASTTHAIVRNGLTPVFGDINPEDYTLDAEKLEDKITENTCAILPVHVYGNLCDAAKIQEIADRHDLKVIYDAAHTFGEELDGQGVAELGDLSMFSFHATKVFHSIEGGAVSYRDPGLADRLYQLKNFGIMDSESVEYVGANGKMNEFQAAMGLCNLRHVDEEIAKRKRLASHYRSRLSGTEGIRLCPENPRVRSNYAYMPVVFDGYRKDRDQVFEELAREDIHVRKYFYPCINSYACYRGQFDERETPVAARISRQILTLPLYADLDMGMVDMICDLILE
ncbi:MAG: DegT/DnrJ/EryC1/StrS family aminotransferase [Lachnospiraceae bacterium]|jgi:dTDP-4-amino-4,6-dideoxygalactose transaminase|nr:DegT/DnrJ/EryC1/StrS family aminotransferase [Lachnospiraceae bacterium]